VHAERHHVVDDGLRREDSFVIFKSGLACQNTAYFKVYCTV
jgi:hypothetical protein